jgi:hypothetical protein
MNFSDKAKQVISTVAPLVGAAIGGPFGGLAGSLLGKLFGSADKPADSSAVEEAVMGGNPDALLKLKQANNEFAEHMKTLQIQEEQLVYTDIASARAREIAVRDNTPKQLAWVVITGFMVVSLVQLIALVGWADQVNKIPPQGWLLIGNISGYLANEAKQAAAYYFGSSIGSKEKDSTLADIAKSA